MWPWGHAAFGYLWYSLVVHAYWRRRPADVPAVAAVFAALLPDLVDKPLGWTLHVTASGYGPAHSVFVGVPLAGLLGVALARRGRAELGAAFAFGYASHALGDLLFHYVGAGRLELAPVLWPVVSTAASHRRGFLSRVAYYLDDYVAAVLAGEATGYVVLSLAVGTAVLLLWVADGRPGLALLPGVGGDVNSRDK